MEKIPCLHVSLPKNVTNATLIIVYAHEVRKYPTQELTQVHIGSPTAYMYLVPWLVIHIQVGINMLVKKRVWWVVSFAFRAM